MDTHVQNTSLLFKANANSFQAIALSVLPLWLQQNQEPKPYSLRYHIIMTTTNSFYRPERPTLSQVTEPLVLVSSIGNIDMRILLYFTIQTVALAVLMLQLEVQSE